jgi:hypothetical protein
VIMSNPVYKKCPACNSIRHKRKGNARDKIYQCRCGCIYHGITRKIQNGYLDHNGKFIMDGKDAKGF